MIGESNTNYVYDSPNPTWNNAYILDVVIKVLLEKKPHTKRIFEIGCGNGANASALCEAGYEVTGIDISSSGIHQANTAHPRLNLCEGSVYEDLASRFGTFPVVMSLEVIEHCFEPRKFCQSIHNLLSNNGIGIISTPYHGYIKNLALAASGRMDKHFSALWDGGHIKFFSIVTITQLFKEQGFHVDRILRLGRFPPIAKTMLAVIEKVDP